jgi:hypothetical protein
MTGRASITYFRNRQSRFDRTSRHNQVVSAE